MFMQFEINATAIIVILNRDKIMKRYMPNILPVSNMRIKYSTHGGDLFSLG